MRSARARRLPDADLDQRPEPMNPALLPIVPTPTRPAEAMWEATWDGASAGTQEPSPLDYRTPVFVGRQGIFRTDGAVHAYEFLYRSGAYRREAVDRWPAPDQDRATAGVLAATFATDRLRSLPADVLVFVNVTRSFLVGDLLVPAAPDRLVLEVVESVEVDDEVVAGLRRLVDQRFRIAIDDFVASEHQRALLPFADYVKLDLRDVTDDPSLVDLARSHGATLVGEHVESAEDAHRCRELGIGLLQGDHLEPAKVFKQAPTT